MFSFSRPLVVLTWSVLFIAVMWMIKGHQERTFNRFIAKEKPEAVYEFLIDFQNIAKTNTRIVYWRPGADLVTNPSRWHYEVTSHEAMLGSDILGLNINRGSVDGRVVKRGQDYTIDTVFVTDSLRGLVVVENESHVRLTPTSRDGIKGTLYTERVVMNCPLLMTQLCNTETNLNRVDFMDNLAAHFGQDD